MAKDTLSILASFHSIGLDILTEVCTEVVIVLECQQERLFVDRCHVIDCLPMTMCSQGVWLIKSITDIHHHHVT